MIETFPSNVSHISLIKRRFLCIRNSDGPAAGVEVIPIGNTLRLRQQPHKLGGGDKLGVVIGKARAGGHDLPALLYKPVGNVRHTKRIIQS